MAGQVESNIYANDGHDDEEDYEDVSVKDEPVSAADPQPETFNLPIASAKVYPEKKKTSTGRILIIILSVLLAILFVIAAVSIGLGITEILRLRDQVEEIKLTQNTVEAEVGRLTGSNHQFNTSLQLLAESMGEELLTEVMELNSSLHFLVQSQVNTLDGRLNQVRTTVNDTVDSLHRLNSTLHSIDFDYTYNSYKRSYIRLVKLSKSWDYAQIHCGAAGEYLLTFSSTSEASWFRDLKAGRNDWAHYTWIGLRGYGTYYRWYGYSISNLASSSWDSYWDSDDPDYTSSSYCGYSRNDGLWWDTDCYTKYYFFCEKL